MAKRLDPADFKAIFKMRPQAAISYLKAKGYTISWNWQQVLDAAHNQTFTVVKAMNLDVLSDIRESLEKALNEGQTVRQFTRNLQPVLEAKGWWGKQVVVDGEGNAEMVQLGSPRRLKTIYQTNLQSAYMAGRKAEMEQAQDSHPYWMYVAVMDAKTRPSHAAINGQVYRCDDPIWATIFPPNGFNCRCRVVPLSAAAVKRMKLTVESSAGKSRQDTVEIGTDKRTGEIYEAQVTRVTTSKGTFSVDPGFNHAPGDGLREALARKEEQL